MQTEQRIQTGCLLLLTAFAIALALHWLAAVMIPFVLAIFITLALHPVIDWLHARARIPRPVATLATLLAGVIGFVLAGSVLSSSIGQISQNAEVYQAEIVSATRELADALPLANLRTLLERQISALPLGSLFLDLAQSLIKLFSNAFLVGIFAVFLMIGRERAGPRPELWTEIEARVSRYVVAKATISAITGLLIGAILYGLGVQMALMFGFLAFLLNFVPSLGSVIATLLPLPILLVSPEISWTTTVLALALPGGVQFLIGNVLEPRLIGEALELHPVTILLALIFWGVLWGIVGMFLAVPITAVLRILADQHEWTRPLGRIMAGRAPRNAAVRARPVAASEPSG